MKICGMFLSGLLVQIVVPDDWEQYVAFADRFFKK